MEHFSKVCSCTTKYDFHGELHLMMGQVSTENLQLVINILKVFIYNLKRKETG